MRKKVVVTGGLGYVGGRICAHLAELGYEVVATSRRVVEGLPFQVAEWSEDLLEGAYAVVHLAAANEIDCARDPLSAIDLNVRETVRTLMAAEKAQVPKFIYFSTVHIYGSPLRDEISEDSRPLPIHPYAITHRNAEDYVLAARNSRAIDGIVVRLSNSFGAPLTPDVNRWTLVVNDLCRQAIEQKSLTLQSSGIPTRDFITLTDVCRAVAHLLSLEKSQSLDGVFNFSGEQTISILAMAERIQARYEALFGEKLPLTRKEPAQGEQPLPLHISAAKLRGTGFNFTGDIDAELDAMLRFCAAHFQGLRLA